MQDVLEADVERRCVAMAEVRGWIDPGKFKKRGSPDRVLAAPDGTTYWIEFKTPNTWRKPKANQWDQRRFLWRLAEKGQKVFIITDEREFMRMVLQHSGIP